MKFLKEESNYEKIMKVLNMQERKHVNKNVVKEDINDDSDEEMSAREGLKQLIAKFGNNKNQYELVAQTYERYESGRPYRIKFFAPNDYIALYSMDIHCAPTVANLEDYGIYGQDILDGLKEHPTFEAFREYQSINAWGDGDDFIYSLTNLTTGKVLYSSKDDEGSDDEEDDDYDFDESLKTESLDSDVEDKAKEVQNPVYADAVRQQKKTSKVKDKATKITKDGKPEIAVKNERFNRGSVKLQLSESLFEDYEEPNDIILVIYKDETEDYLYNDEYQADGHYAELEQMSAEALDEKGIIGYAHLCRNDEDKFIACDAYYVKPEADNAVEEYLNEVNLTK